MQTTISTRGTNNDGTQWHVKALITICVALGLLMLTFWLAELATYNMWAAGRPNVSPTIVGTYAFRSNTFFVLSIISFLSFVGFCLWKLIRIVRSKRGQ
jgi:hypothetical protein